MNIIGKGFVVVSVGLVSILVVLFLGGLASAALEIRREKRAGLPVTRPAWEQRAQRRASGGYLATIRGTWKGLRAQQAAQSAAAAAPAGCFVCGGPLMLTDGVETCVADLNGDPIAERSHNAFDGNTWDDRHAVAS